MSLWPTGFLDNKNVIVSGGSSGIGAAIAVAFQEEGANVKVTCATKAEQERAIDELNLDAHVLDVRDKVEIGKFFTNTKNLDHLINCAGVIKRQAELQVDVFEDVIDINLNGTMRMCAAAKDLLAKNQGCIVNTASMLSFFGGGMVPAYSASKGGVAQLTKSLAIAYAQDGIRVNAIAPGWIATPLTQALQNDKERAEPILARTPLKRWGTPEEMIGGVAYFCSPLASFVTGSILAIDGGYLIT